MSVTINGTSGITTPGVNSTSSNTLGDNVADTLNVGNGAIVTDASGNVGIGTSSPAYKLSVVSSATGNVTMAQYKIATSTYKGLCIDTNDNAGWVGNDTLTAGEGILFQNTTNAARFYTNNTERMRIDSSGNILTGTTTASSSSGVGGKYLASATAPSYSLVGSSSTTDASYVLYSTGAAAYRFYVQYDGKIYATNTTITGISDARLKENIVDLDDGLNAILSLKPRRFDWKSGKGKDIKNDRGFIAQEFEQVFPDLIDEWKDPAPEGEEPYKSVRADLIPVLVKAIQEQQAQIETLTAKVAALEAK